jgi:hypothetical protein
MKNPREGRTACKDHIKRGPARAANKTITNTGEPENRLPSVDFTKNTWSVRMAAAWAGIPERTLYRLLSAGAVPCIAMGDSQIQHLSTAKSGKRVRKCYRFVIPRAAFMRAWENLGNACGSGNTGA